MEVSPEDRKELDADKLEVSPEDRKELDAGCTAVADYSMVKMRKLIPTMAAYARGSRLGGVPKRGLRNHKLVTRSVWVNNNRLRSMKGLDLFIDSIIEYPNETGWIDLSYNYIQTIDAVILKYPNLAILYLHGNCIEDLEEIIKLRALKKLKTVTFHGNPISNIPVYRRFVLAALPQVLTLDFTPATKREKSAPAPPQLAKLLKSLE